MTLDLKQIKKKIKSLNIPRDAGWSLEKITDEMDCAPQTVANHLNAMKGE